MSRATDCTDVRRTRLWPAAAGRGAWPSSGRRLLARKTTSLLALLLAASAFLNGCVYLRLVLVKQQLAKPERTLALDASDGLRLSFLEPVLHPGDVLRIARRRPSQVEDDQDPVRWIYRFSKRARGAAGSGGRFDVAVELFFSGGRLSGGRLPERFGRILDPGFVRETLRAIGRSRVEVAPRTVLGRIPPERVDGGSLPTPHAVARLFGRPHQRIDEGGGVRLLYRYRLERDHGSPRARTGRVEVAFTFLPGSGRLVRVQARFADLCLDLVYPPGSSPAHPS